MESGSVRWELEGEPKTLVSEAGVKKSVKRKGIPRTGVGQRTGQGPGARLGTLGGTGGQAVTRMRRRGASVPVTKATVREPHLPSPHTHTGPSPASLRPPPPPLFCFHGNKRRGAGSKHNALWKTCGSGDPPAAPARGRALRGPRAAQTSCRFVRAPRTRHGAQNPLLLLPPRPRVFRAPLHRGSLILQGAQG